jgi:hypothetical protein
MVSLKQGLIGHWRRMILVPFLCCALTLVVPPGVRAKADKIFSFRAGVLISRDLPLSSNDLETLLNDLRFFTGFMELRVEESGRLHLGDRRQFIRGSHIARQLLAAAVDSQDSFILEGSRYSSTIAFAEIEPTEVFFDAMNRRHEVWRIRLDFADFASLRGPDKAVVSFGPSLALLHELGHGVLKKPDLLSQEDDLGDCERHMNLIRKELGLPERESYEPRNWRAASPGRNAESLQAEFKFSIIDKQSNKRKTFYLSFDVDRVCDVAKIRSLPPGRGEIFVARR